MLLRSKTGNEPPRTQRAPRSCLMKPSVELLGQRSGYYEIRDFRFSDSKSSSALLCVPDAFGGSTKCKCDRILNFFATKGT